MTSHIKNKKDRKKIDQLTELFWIPLLGTQILVRSSFYKIHQYTALRTSCLIRIFMQFRVEGFNLHQASTMFFEMAL